MGTMRHVVAVVRIAALAAACYNEPMTSSASNQRRRYNGGDASNQRRRRCNGGDAHGTGNACVADRRMQQQAENGSTLGHALTPNPTCPSFLGRIR